MKWRCQRFHFGSASQSLNAGARCAGRLANTTLIVCQLDPSSTAISLKRNRARGGLGARNARQVTLVPAAFPIGARNGRQSRPTVSFAHLLRHLECPGQDYSLLRSREDSNLRLWFSLGRLDSPGQLASVLPEAASDVRHGAQIAPGAPMAEFWPKYANLMNWGDPPACGIPP